MAQSQTARTDLIARLVAGGLRCYQWLSASGSRRCRFYPTCSEYVRQAVLASGVWRGMGQGVKRILKCHPWHPGGIDLIKTTHGQ